MFNRLNRRLNDKCPNSQVTSRRVYLHGRAYNHLIFWFANLMRSLSIDTLLLEQQRVGFFGCPTKAKEPTKASSVSDLKKKLSVKAIDPIVYQCFCGKCHKKNDMSSTCSVSESSGFGHACGTSTNLSTKATWIWIMEDQWRTQRAPPEGSERKCWKLPQDYVIVRNDWTLELHHLLTIQVFFSFKNQWNFTNFN